MAPQNFEPALLEEFGYERRGRRAGTLDPGPRLYGFVSSRTRTLMKPAGS